MTACTNVRQGVEKTVWNVQKSFRKPGEKSLELPEVVWQSLECENRQLPFIKIEANQLLPRRVRPGEDFNHRLVYAMCSNKRADEVIGTLYTRIYFRSDPIHEEVTEDYTIKPGRWRVDAFIELPPTAETGVYAFEVQFESDQLGFQEQISFVVESQ